MRLWLSEDTGPVDEIMEASWQGKITITASYIPPVNTKNMMIAIRETSEFFGHGDDDYEMYYNLTYSQDNKYDVSRVVYQSEVNPYSEAVEIVDFSEAQDKSVLGYYVKNEDNTTYTLYIQADGKIKVNKVASYIGLIRGKVDWTNSAETYGIVDGIENLDTSLVTDMSYMFAISSIESLDLSSFETNNVTDMSSMFYQMPNLTSLNLNTLDTTNVTDMSFMFSGCNSLTSLDLASFDTSSVTKMFRMFYDCRSLTSLDLTVFNTANVTDMNSMFEYATNLATITYGPNFILKKDANVTDMFNNCPANKPTDSSWSNATF